ncbi:hypothetical protein [Pedobacter nutrimenti]|nr:hypothetical protein [Pedobacter nutrimenti]
MEETRFGFLNVNNQTTYKDLNISYNDVPKSPQGPTYNQNIKIPAGTGKLSFKDPAGKTVLETAFSIEADKTKELILFQPVADLKPVVLENNQKEEPKPQKGYLKIKAANFAIHAFKKSIDLILYYDDPLTGDRVEFANLKNVSPEFKDYQTFRYPGDLSADMQFSVMIVDSQSQEPLLDWYTSVTATLNKSVYTMYIKENTEGAAVLGTPYFVTVESLFAD